MSKRNIKLVRRRFETQATPCFVGIHCTDEKTIRTLYKPLCAIGRRSAPNTDGQSLCDVFRDRKELRHRIEWFTSKILIKTSHDDALSAVRQPVAYINQVHIEELRFIDHDHLRAAVN